MEVILVTYRSSAVIQPLLHALKSIPNVRICVVDNASRDDTVKIARSYADRLIEQVQNVGFGRAANLGAEASTEEMLCFMNPDCRVDENVMLAGERALAATAKSTVAVPMLKQADGIIPGKQPGYTWRKLLTDILETNARGRRLVARLKASSRYHDERWHWPLGACFFVRRDDFMKIGGFSEDYFMYMEDVDFGRRFCRAGGEIIQMNELIEHYAGEGSAIDWNRRLGLLNAARLRYGRAWCNPLVYLMLRICLTGRPKYAGPMA